MKTSELKGAALDWAVAKCEGGYNFDATGLPWDVDASNPDDDENGAKWFTPSTDWAQGGPIIERERLEIHNATDGSKDWVAHAEFQVYAFGPTPLIAVMRCYITSKLGEEVDVPEELT